MREREAIATLRRLVTEMTHALERPCRSDSLLTFVSRDRLQRWQQELVDVGRLLADGTADAEAARRWRRPLSTRRRLASS